ncbi:AAA family ATPase [Nocardia sp. SYP-A9097]|uniref:BTAD domain-containing putative transcriptional regulator n=1 Tax=Nocardia sp. SYP-A9097 TaxID=2663237 RepID=UPI00129ABF47|nr:BTAD domain-containing putative transcriptional regulator [Nocardia sp. SYP-A9097]MRH87787.1 AAA family ATPase [Nocardia sp. SYP-A9097]
MVRIQVLGSLTAQTGRGSVDLGGRRQRGVLTLLLVARGAVVPVDRLIDDLWRGEPPTRALGTLQAYISHLRKLLEPDRLPRSPATVLVSQAPGYALRLAPEAVDAWQFEAELRSAPTDPVERRRSLEQALGRWHGPAFAEFSDESWARAEASRLEELRLAARERLAATLVELGDPTAAAVEADALTSTHPLREEAWRVSALARFHAGRQADALAALRAAREVLADQLGIDPGPALVQLEADLLAQRIPIDVPAPVPLPTPTAEPSEVHSEFVGRTRELDELQRAAGVGRAPRVAAVIGEAGSGKSLLLQRFRAELGNGGWRVITGRCPEEDGAPPAWAWVEALRELTATVDPGHYAAPLEPLLADRRTGFDADAAVGRFLLHRAVGAYLDEAAQRQPLAVFLDDLHRADLETLTLLGSVAKSASILIVISYRPDEIAMPLEDTLASLATVTAARIRLRGLDFDDATVLIRSISGHDPDRATLAALTERTGGNPFYLIESARLLGSEGALVAMSEVPQGVRDVLRRRFARLPAVSVSVLRLAAVIGREFDIEVLIGAAEIGEGEVLDAVEAGVLAGLLEEPGSDHARFTHALIRDTLLGDLSRIRRRRWHLRIAESIERTRPDDLSALAHHFGESLTAATARRAADAARAAADQAERRFAHDAAAESYGRVVAALERISGVNTAAERVAALSRMSRSYLAAGAGLPARDARDRAVSAADTPELLVEALTAWDTPTPWLNRAYGSVDQQVVASIEAVLRTSGLTPQARCRLLVALVREIGGELHERAREAAAEAESLARGLRDPGLLGLALQARLSVYDTSIPLADRDRLATELVSLGEDNALPVLALIGHNAAFQVAAARGDVDRANSELVVATLLADRYHWAQARAANLMGHAMIAHLTGNLEAAEQGYRQAHEFLERHKVFDADGNLLIALVALRLTQGRVGEFATLLAETFEQLDSSGNDVVVDPFALALLATGDRRGALAATRARRPLRNDFFRSLFLTVRGMAVVGLEQRAEAAQVYQQLRVYSGQIAGADTGAHTAGPVDTVLGDLAALLGKPDLAAEHYATAERLAHRCGCREWISAVRDRIGSQVDR